MTDVGKRIGIVGSRDYKDLDMVRSLVSGLPEDTVVVSGGARGVDSVAVAFAKSLGMKTVVFPANWEKYGKSAGALRNMTIVENSDRIVAFWDGVSKGTMITVDMAKKKGIPVLVIHDKEVP